MTFRLCFPPSKHAFSYINAEVRTKINNYDKIHKSEALIWEDKRTLTLVECQN